MKTYYIQQITTSNITDDSRNYSIHEDIEDAKGVFNICMMQLDQGHTITSEIYEVFLNESDFKDFDPECEDFDYFVSNLTQTQLREIVEEKMLKTVYTQQFSGYTIEDRIIISYCHDRYMNYAHTLLDIRVGETNETTSDLSCNPDHVFKRWDLLTTLTIQDLLNHNPEDAIQLLLQEITYLKLRDFSKIRNFVNKEVFELA